MIEQIIPSNRPDQAPSTDHGLRLRPPVTLTRHRRRQAQVQLHPADTPGCLAALDRSPDRRPPPRALSGCRSTFSRGSSSNAGHRYFHLRGAPAVSRGCLPSGAAGQRGAGDRWRLLPTGLRRVGGGTCRPDRCWGGPGLLTCRDAHRKFPGPRELGCDRTELESLSLSLSGRDCEDDPRWHRDLVGRQLGCRGCLTLGRAGREF